jgi:hypothetical protein
MAEMGAVERALELARSGTVRSVADIRRTLQQERRDSVDQHLASNEFKKQLKALIEARLNPAVDKTTS